MTRTQGADKKAGSKRSPGRPIRNRLALNVRRLRKAQGMTQAQLAHTLEGGYSREVISEVERGQLNVPLALLEAIASALQCKECDLLDRPRRERRS